MYVEYGNLMSFANAPQFNTMSESRLLTQICNWIREGVNVIDGNYWFTITYIFDANGIAVDASILVQIKTGLTTTESLGSYSPFGRTTLTDVIGIFEEQNCEECTPSSIISVPQPYYVDGYYVPDYYVEI